MAHDGPIEALTTFISENPPGEIDIADNVSDAEAVIAIQQHYVEAGFECTTEQAQEMIFEARADTA